MVEEIRKGSSTADGGAAAGASTSAPVEGDVVDIPEGQSEADEEIFLNLDDLSAGRGFTETSLPEEPTKGQQECRTRGVSGPSSPAEEEELERESGPCPPPASGLPEYLVSALSTWQQERFHGDRPNILRATQTLLGVAGYLVDEGRLVGVEGRVRSLEAEVARLREENSRWQENAGSLELKWAEESSARLEAEKKAADMEAAGLEAAGKVEELERWSSELELKTSEGEMRLLELEEQLTEANGKASAAEDRIRELEASLRARESDLRRAEEAATAREAQVTAEVKKLKERHRASLSTSVRHAIEMGESCTRRCVFWAYPDLDWSKVDDMVKAGKGDEPHPKDDEWIRKKI